MAKEKKNFYEKAHALLAKLVLRLFRVRVFGRENLPAEGGYLYCSNHICLLDPVLIAAAAITQVHFMAKKELFKVPLLSSLIRILGAYPIDRSGADVGAVRHSIELLKEKKSIGVFIQGHRQKGTPLRETKPKNGVALIALRSGSPIIPVCIKMKKDRYVLFRRVNIIFGSPMSCGVESEEGQGKGEYAQIAGQVFSEICRLEDEFHG